MSGIEDLFTDETDEDYSFEHELQEVCNSIVMFADYFNEDDVVTVFAGKATLTGKVMEINDFILVLETTVNPETYFIAIDKISCIKLIEPGVELNE